MNEQVNNILSLPPQYVVYWYKNLSSTNTIARDLAQRGAQDSTIVVAEEQSKGKGRYDRQWVSVQGNLYMSIIIRSCYTIDVLAQLAFVTTIALSSAINLPQITYKWPNDLLIEGEKCAGILLEASLCGKKPDWLIIGIGINVHNAPMQYPATFLQKHGCRFSIPELLQRIITNFALYRQKWLLTGFKDIRELWIKRAVKLGEEITINERIHGIFKELDRYGRLVLQRDGTLEYITIEQIFDIYN